MEKYIDLKNHNDYTKLQYAGNTIKNGGLVLFPTETVYGLGADGLNADAVRKIYEAKGRKQDNPLILHISEIEMLDRIATDITELEYKLMHAFWPGPFTIILNKKPIVPNNVTGGMNTVGVRMPSGTIARKLISYADTPIAAPSANVSGRPSGTNVKDIYEELHNKVDCIVDGGDCEYGLESTVVRVINNIPTILRPGEITPNDIEKIAGIVNIDKNVLNKIDINEKVLSPGMKYRHYAPKSKCVLVYSDDNNKLVNKIIEISKEYNNPLIISSTENKVKYNIKNIIDVGHKDNLMEIAKNIFTTLRKVDSYSPDLVIIEGVKEEGIGLAIMNRLIRACEYNYIKI